MQTGGPSGAGSPVEVEPELELAPLEEDDPSLLPDSLLTAEDVSTSLVCVLVVAATEVDASLGSDPASGVQAAAAAPMIRRIVEMRSVDTAP